MCTWASEVAQWQWIHLPKLETWVWSLGQEDPLEDKTATHSSILACRQRSLAGYSSGGWHRVRHNWARMHAYTSIDRYSLLLLNHHFQAWDVFSKENRKVWTEFYLYNVFKGYIYIYIYIHTHTYTVTIYSNQKEVQLL